MTGVLLDLLLFWN